MTARTLCLLFAVLSLDGSLVAVAEEFPQPVDKRLKIELFAENPQINTPTGIDVDQYGRVWAIESNTHFPPADYAGHSSDRVFVFEDTNGDGHGDQRTEFADGFTHAMSVAVRPNGDIYIATRRAIFLLKDADNDLKPDVQKVEGKETDRRVLVKLETPGNYPHNGLAGFAFNARDHLFFGFGENLGADYAIIGSDGTKLTGGGEGGNIYRCSLRGENLKLWATGFWNPHANCVDAFGRLFSVDNDPDSRPPCRLLHIIRDGDYGYRFRNGRKGLHPFTAWNGEIPGTLPMVAGTGEAPSGIVAYESDGLPKDYIGNLLVTSWGDHRIERYRLKPKGASFTSTTEPIIQGGKEFRPVGIAVAPDGSLYCTDWVKRDYKLHGHGRIWKISAVKAIKDKNGKAPFVRLEDIDKKIPYVSLHNYLAHPRIEIRRKAARELAKGGTLLRPLLTTNNSLKEASERTKAEALEASFLFSGTEERLKLLAEVPVQGSIVDAIYLSLFETITDQKLFEQHFFKRISPKKSKPIDPEVILAAMQYAHEATMIPQRLIDLHDPFQFSAAIQVYAKLLVKNPALKQKAMQALKNSPKARTDELMLPMILAWRQNWPDDEQFLKDVAFKLNAEAYLPVVVQWIAEEKLVNLKPEVEQVLQRDGLTSDLFLATLAALEMLDGKNPAEIDKTPPTQYLLRIVENPKQSAKLRATALRMIPPEDPVITKAVMEKLLSETEPLLRLEAVRTLQGATFFEGAGMLERIAVNESEPEQLRAEAILGWSNAFQLKTPLPPSFLKLLADPQISHDLRREMLRSVRGLTGENRQLEKVLLEVAGREKAKLQTAEKIERGEQFLLALEGVKASMPDNLAKMMLTRLTKKPDWPEVVKEGTGDAESGRRVFFHARGAGCFRCHTINGRGGKLGPDLSNIANNHDRQKLLLAILEPSKEVSPQFTSWTFLMASGKTVHGLIVAESGGTVTIGTPEGKQRVLQETEIEERSPSKTSLMPAKLVERLTMQEMRDLLAFLESLKSS